MNAVTLELAEQPPLLLVLLSEVTVTVQRCDNALPCAFVPMVVTVITAVPSLFAVTFPCASTPATEELLLCHRTDCGAVSGLIVLIRFSLWFTCKVIPVLFKARSVIQLF